MIRRGHPCGMALVMEIDERVLAAKFEALLPHLDERQRRLAMGAEARVLGHGGIGLVAKAAGVSRKTVSAGVSELESGQAPLGRTRRSGGGGRRRPNDPQLLDALDALVEPESRGDPMTRLRWTTRSTRNLADELGRQGRSVSHDTVARLLAEELGYSLQANAKTVEGRQHPDRDAQFRYINDQVAAHISAGQPVVSADTKKELVGNYKNGGREWQPQGEPVGVNVHDFADKQLGKVAPYGVYDVAANTGWVSVGVDHDTAEFAAETIRRRWWNKVGTAAYPSANRLLICADGGGSNGYRTRLWKRELATLATETGLSITVCHLPPGTSKWNKIEHRLFSQITMNWRGRPLESHEVIVNLIAGTTTRTGLRVHAELDHSRYPKGIKISDKDMRTLEQNHITRHEFHGEWNYCVHPARSR